MLLVLKKGFIGAYKQGSHIQAETEGAEEANRLGSGSEII